MKKLFVLSAAILLSACSTTNVGLKYEAPPTTLAASSGSTAISVGTFTDQRGEPEHWLGAIRGGFGNPLKKLESDQTVSQLVQTAFSDGLQSRHFPLADSTSPFQLSGVIRKLSSDQVARREANVEIEVSVTDLASGKQTFAHTYTANNIEGSALTLSAGVFGSVEDLRTLTEKTLREVVDKALDDTALRNALRS